MNFRKWFIAGFVLLTIIFFALNKLLVDWLWFNSVGYSSVWLKIVSTNIVLYSVLFLLLLAFFAFNIYKTRANILYYINHDYVNRQEMSLKNYLLQTILKGPYVQIVLGFIIVFLAFSMTYSSGLSWEELQKFLYSTQFGYEDPIFQKDISFYVFKLPFIFKITEIIYYSLMVAAIFSLALYLLTMPSLIINISHFSKVHGHLILLAVILFFFKSIACYLERYLLLYSTHGVGFGAGYADVYARLPGLYLLAIASLIISILCLSSYYHKNLRWVLGGLSLLLITSLGVRLVYPGFVQRFHVEPNEFNREKPFIEYNISHTLRAYGLDKIKIEEFPANSSLVGTELAENKKTLNNIRLWDWRPLEQTFNQLQSLRPYYCFTDVDVDRYPVDGEMRQVIISARELDSNRLSTIQADNWINKHLRYTHGYGAVIIPANEVTAEGLPNFYLKDIPLMANEPFEIDRPEIYFGEKTIDYILVKTKMAEFDYPLGDDNAENYYEGQGGIPINNYLARLTFATYFKDYKLLLTRELTEESRIIFYRQIEQRVKKIAPFLEYDQDPYLVIGDKKLYWIQDAYVTSLMHPYAQPYNNQFNYIRNPIKVVTDAYNGEVTFYLQDPQEPIAATYAKIFPQLFKPISQMPEDLKNHLRYPETLFKIQSEIFTSYHMENPMVFYNKEDLWSIPEEIVAGETVTMEPYYVIMQLPNQNEAEEFILMLPFNAARINKMVAWLAARNDSSNYGELILYKFPKDKHIYGPLQVESRIDQDSEISQQLSLWDQRGSQVLRGNLLVIPIGESILYIEPLYLQAEKSKIPELRQVIAVLGDKIVMEKTAEEALEKIFAAIPKEEMDETQKASLAELVQLTYDYYQEAIEKQKAGDWAGYGLKLQELEKVILRLQQLVETTE